MARPLLCNKPQGKDIRDEEIFTENVFGGESAK